MIEEENNSQKIMEKKLCARFMDEKKNAERIKHKAHGAMNSSWNEMNTEYWISKGNWMASVYV